MTATTMTDRTTASPWTLLARAAGPPAALARKTRDLGRALGKWFDGTTLDARLTRLRDLGHIERIPNRVQLIVGSADMLRFWISPAAADYYASKGINFTFHQVLRVLDDPASMVDPIGFTSTRDTIIGHILQVVHANPRYDLQLLDSHPDGVAELERQTRQMLEGTHPRQASIGAIVEDPDYHRRLLGYVREYRADPLAVPPVRDNVAADADLRRIERTFGTLPAAMRYFCRLPDTPWGAARHLVTVRTFPFELGEPGPDDDAA